jgi:ribosomal protein S18 acetylase RimI-like enzyme
MIDLKIVPYTVKDNESALFLEEQCVQGKSLVLKFRRPTFHARSEVYDNYKILCAKLKNELIGTIAWAKKAVQFHREMIRAVYLYDLRVDPAFRRKGIAQRLAKAVLDDIGQDNDYIYTLIAGQNERVLELAKRLFETKFFLPLTYLVLSVDKRRKEKGDYNFTNAATIHKRYLEFNPNIEFVPELNEKRMLGYVTSVAMGKEMDSGCSVWTNENLLAEEVVEVPRYYQLMRILTTPFRSFLNLPYIPKATDKVRSWFLFDFYVKDEKYVNSLLAAINNLAIGYKRNFVYILLQNNDPALTFIKKSGYRVFTFPYFILTRGRVIPTQTEKIYIDIRDL